MPKFRILCSTGIQYTCVVEAPTREAADLWYENSDGNDFSKGDEDGWYHDETVPFEGDENLEDPDVVVVVDADGNRIEETPCPAS